MLQENKSRACSGSKSLDLLDGLQVVGSDRIFNDVSKNPWNCQRVQVRTRHLCVFCSVAFENIFHGYRNVVGRASQIEMGEWICELCDLSDEFNWKVCDRSHGKEE